MMAFAQFMYNSFGRNLKELIYTPLGFSVKDGRKVPPYAQSTHMDHVHVAYAKGPGNPAIFGSLPEAQSFENRFKPSGAKTLTTNTTELAGLLDGLFGKKAPKLKPGQKPTMSEFGTGVGEQLLRRKKEQEKYLKLLRSSEDFTNKGGAYISPDGMRPGGGAGSMASAPINITSPITINQQPGQSADELASIVAMKIGEAVADARAASIFV
jgi:hypothetical protein